MGLVQGKASVLICCLGLLMFTALVGCDDTTPSTPDAAVTDAADRDQAPIGDASPDTAADAAGDLAPTPDGPIPDGPGPGDGPKPTVIDPAVAAKAALMLASCVPDDKPASLLSTLYYEKSNKLWSSGGLFTSAALSCLLTKKSGCAAVKDCLGIVVKSDPSCVKGCKGNVATSCDSPMSFQVDCQKAGFYCLNGKCVESASAPSCSYSTYQASCKLGQPHYCGSSIERHGPTCSKLGLKCSVDTNGAACRGPDGACAGTSVSPSSPSYEEAIACAAGKLTACVNMGKATIGCAQLGQGFSCQKKGAKVFCGTASACDPTDSAAAKALRKCAGTSVTFCNAGAIVTVDCVSLGFTKCLPTVGLCGPGPYGG